MSTKGITDCVGIIICSILIALTIIDPLSDCITKYFNINMTDFNTLTVIITIVKALIAVTIGVGLYKLIDKLLEPKEK